MNLMDQVLIASLDNFYENSVSVQDLNFELAIPKFRENKVSLERLSQIVDTSSEKVIQREVDRDKISRRKWLLLFKFTVQLFKSQDVQYVFIKLLNYPWAIMDDLDVLPLNATEELKALEALHKLGFELFQFRLLAHPLKIMAVEAEANVEQKISVDFYPELLWVRKKVCDTEIIFARKRTSSINGIEVPVPSPEDDLYLVGTHAYNHLKFTLAEILHGLNILSNNSNFDWDYLYNLATDYGTVDAIYAYIKSMDVYSKFFRKQSTVNEDILVKFQRARLCKKIDSWFKNKYLKTISFPICISSRIACIYSSFYHCGTMLGRMPLSELTNDFLSHYLVLSSKIILGKT